MSQRASLLPTRRTRRASSLPTRKTRRASSFPRKTRRASVQSSGPSQTRSVSRRASTGSYKPPDPSKFTRIIVGNSPVENSPNIFKQPEQEGIFRKFRIFRRNSPKEKNHTNVAVPKGTKPEDIEAIQITKFFSFKERQNMKAHLKKWMKKNPKSTYEEWVENYLHDSAKRSRYNHIMLDRRFFLKNAESLRYWKNLKKRLRSDTWTKV